MGRPPKTRKGDFMEVVTALKGNSLIIGIQGENMARVVKFDISRFAAYGPGTAMVVFQRPGDRNPYLVGTETEGNYLLWTITSTETERAGHGWCELRYVNPSGLIIKSEIWRTYCGRSIQDMTDPLSKPYDSYLDQMSQLGALTTQNAAQTAQDVVEANTTLERVENAGSQALSDIQTAGTTHLSNINTAGEAQVSAVSAEGAAKVEAVQSEGASQVEAVKSEGAAQVANVTAAAEAITGKVAQINANTDGITQLRGDINTNIVNLMGATADFSKNVCPAGWETSSSTFTFANNVMQVDVMAKYGGAKAPVSVIANHTYYYYALIKATSNRVSLSWNGNYAVMHSGDGRDYELLSKTNTFTSAGTQKISILDARASGRDAIYIKEIGVIDLTACFGADNEPSKAQMDVLLSYASYHIIGSLGVGALAQSNCFNVTNLKNAVESLEINPVGYNSSVTSIVGEFNLAKGNGLYKADSITISTNGNDYCGCQIYVYNPPIGDVIKVKCGSRTNGNYVRVFRVDCQDENGQRLSSEHFASGTELDTLVLEGTHRVEITLFACWGVALSSGTQVTFNDVEVSTVDVYGSSGNLLYTGEPIVITDEYKKPNKCNYELWKDFVGTEISNLASYNLYKQQAIAIYNDYVFMLNEGGDGLVLDYNTKNIISQISTQPTAYQHHNSAQFTNIYYNASDEFPLLMTSMCGNQIADLTDYDVAQFYRIQRSGTTFTFTLVNTIKTDFITRGCSWGIDNGNNKLYMVGGRTGYSESNFVCEFFVWEMPTREQIISGSQITVYEADKLSYMTYPRFTVQGIYVNGGIAYVGRSIENVGQFLYAVDISANRLLSEIPLTDYKELEGVAIYDGCIFVSQKDGTDTSATNPAKIYKISFGY